MAEYTVREAAQDLGLSHDTVTRLIRSGLLRGRKKNQHARTSAFLIDAVELERFRREVRGRMLLRDADRRGVE